MIFRALRPWGGTMSAVVPAPPTSWAWHADARDPNWLEALPRRAARVSFNPHLRLARAGCERMAGVARPSRGFYKKVATRPHLDLRALEYLSTAKPRVFPSIGATRNIEDVLERSRRSSRATHRSHGACRRTTSSYEDALNLRRSPCRGDSPWGRSPTTSSEVEPPLRLVVRWARGRRRRW